MTTTRHARIYDPVSRHYAQLAVQLDYEAWLLTWLPGQGIDWHERPGGEVLELVSAQLAGLNW